MASSPVITSIVAGRLCGSILTTTRPVPTDAEPTRDAWFAVLEIAVVPGRGGAAGMYRPFHFDAWVVPGWGVGQVVATVGGSVALEHTLRQFYAMASR